MAADGSKEQLFAEASASCAGFIQSLAFAHESDPWLRGELVQDILLAIWAALPGFRGESSVRTFAAAIARRRCFSHSARRAREPRQVELRADLICAGAAPDEAALEKDRRRLLTKSIRQLPISQREAITLCLEGFSYVETATILGISVNAAMLRCQRAKAILSMQVKRSVELAPDFISADRIAPSAPAGGRGGEARYSRTAAAPLRG
jgi:RNA polymerase sigma-70 factor (ECF subfamily)